MAMKSVNICVDPKTVKSFTKINREALLGTDPPLETPHICITQLSAFTSMHWLNQNYGNNEPKIIHFFFFYVGPKRQVFLASLTRSSNKLELFWM